MRLMSIVRCHTSRLSRSARSSWPASCTPAFSRRPTSRPSKHAGRPGDGVLDRRLVAHVAGRARPGRQPPSSAAVRPAASASTSSDARRARPRRATRAAARPIPLPAPTDRPAAVEQGRHSWALVAGRERHAGRGRRRDRLDVDAGAVGAKPGPVGVERPQVPSQATDSMNATGESGAELEQLGHPGPGGDRLERAPAAVRDDSGPVAEPAVERLVRVLHRERGLGDVLGQAVHDEQRDLAVDGPQALEDRSVRADRELELLAGPVGQRAALGPQDPRRHGAAEPVDLLLEEALGGLQQPQAGLGPLHERALALDPVDQAALLEPAERLADRGARQPEAVAEIGLRGTRAPGSQRPRRSPARGPPRAGSRTGPARSGRCRGRELSHAVLQARSNRAWPSSVTRPL